MTAASEPEGLSDVDELLIAALGEGRSHAAAGELAGVSAKTVQRRLRKPEFARAVGDRRRQRVGELAGLLMGAAERALRVLLEVLEHGERSEQLRAAQMVLDNSRRYSHDQAVEDDLALRVRVLEELASELQGDEWPARGHEHVPEAR
jgi:hypothetical protein